MTFEEDLAYAHKVLRVRNILETQSYLSNPRFRHFSLRPDIFEYHMKRGHGDEIVIGYHEKRYGAGCPNWYSWDTLVVNPLNNFLQIGGLTKAYLVHDDELTEEWHFQNSLLMEPDALTGLMTVTMLRTVPTKFEYFQLKVRHLDDIIQRYELP